LLRIGCGADRLDRSRLKAQRLAHQRLRKWSFFLRTLNALLDHDDSAPIDAAKRIKNGG
jgi:hypothetical protein